MTYANSERITEINILKEHILNLLPKTYFKPASKYVKHVKGIDEDKRKGNSVGNNGSGQFLYSLSDERISELEKIAIENGEIREFRERVGNPTPGMNQYYFRYDFGEEIGYANGEEISIISVEITNANTSPEVHSHPRNF